MLSSVAFTRASQKAVERALGGLVTDDGFSENVVATLADELEEFSMIELEANDDDDDDEDVDDVDVSGSEDEDQLSCFYEFESEEGGNALKSWVVSESAAADMLRAAPSLPIEVEEDDIEDMARAVLDELRKELRNVMEMLEREASEDGCCELCGRDGMKMTRHHLRPRETHALLLKRGVHERRELQKTARCCRSCHSAIHAFVPDNLLLAQEYFTVDRLLLGVPKLKAFVVWNSRQRNNRKTKLRQ